MLLHNYRGLEISDFLRHWWPLVFILWGGIKIYERTVASRTGDTTASGITVGEVFLVFGLLLLLLAVEGIDRGANIIRSNKIDFGNSYTYDLDVAPKTVAPNAHILVRIPRGDITITASDESEIRVSGKKNVHAWNESDGQRVADAANVEIVQNGDGYEIRPTSDDNDSRFAADVEISVPKKATVVVRSEKGDIVVSDMTTPVSITSSNGDIEIRDTAGDVSVEAHKGDIKVSDTKGNVKISGKGDQIDVTSVTGSLTLDGEFFGPIRTDKIAKGVRFISRRTDLTLTQLNGHMEAGSGNLEIVDAAGNLALRTTSYDVTIENATGKVKVDNRNGEIQLRFSTPPKEDVEITNSKGSIGISLPGSSNFEINADCHSCDISSDFSDDNLKQISKESGDSHLEGKVGSGRGPKITLKTSYDSINIHKTS